MGLKTRIVSNMSIKNNNSKNLYNDSNTEVIVLEKFSDISRIKEIAENLDVSYYAVAAILTNKNLKHLTENEIKQLITAPLENEHPVEKYKETQKAIKHLIKAIETGEEIGIYGDYDGDGVTSALIIDGVLSDFVPEDKLHHQFSRVMEDGFDFSIHGLEKLAEKGCKTIVVLDTGSNSVETLKKAKELGIQCIVMDHHEFNDDTEKVPGVIYVNPHNYPNLSNENELKNAGLSWYFARKLYKEINNSDDAPEKLYGELLGYAALGTLADAGGQLEGPYNRALLHYGIQPEVLSKIDALEELMDGNINFDNTSLPKNIEIIQQLSLGKRISSVLPGDIFKALSNRTTPAERNRILSGLSSSHQQFINTSNSAAESVSAVHAEKKSNVVVEMVDPKILPPDFIGTTGIIANKMSRQFGQPAFVFAKNEDGSFKGSFRTGNSKMDGMATLTRLQTKYPEIMTKFGGHSVAGGISIENEEKFLEFQNLMNQFVDYQVTHEPGYLAPKNGKKFADDGTNKIFATATVPADRILDSKLEDVLKLAPFSGFGVRSPSFYTQKLSLESASDDKLYFKDGKGKVVTMDNSNNLSVPSVGKEYDIVFEVARGIKGKINFILKELQTSNG